MLNVVNLYSAPPCTCRSWADSINLQLDHQLCDRHVTRGENRHPHWSSTAGPRAHSCGGDTDTSSPSKSSSTWRRHMASSERDLYRSPSARTVRLKDTSISCTDCTLFCWQPKCNVSCNVAESSGTASPHFMCKFHYFYFIVLYHMLVLLIWPHVSLLCLPVLTPPPAFSRQVMSTEAKGGCDVLLSWSHDSVNRSGFCRLLVTWQKEFTHRQAWMQHSTVFIWHTDPMTSLPFMVVTVKTVFSQLASTDHWIDANAKATATVQRTWRRADRTHKITSSTEGVISIREAGL